MPAGVRCRFTVRPGVTGLWQVSGRSRLSWEDTVRLDLYYVDNWSMTQDLMILARTAKAVVGSDGALTGYVGGVAAKGYLLRLEEQRQPSLFDL